MHIQQKVEKAYSSTHGVIRQEVVAPGDYTGNPLPAEAFFHKIGLPVGTV